MTESIKAFAKAEFSVISYSYDVNYSSDTGPNWHLSWFLKTFALYKMVSRARGSRFQRFNVVPSPLNSLILDLNNQKEENMLLGNHLCVCSKWNTTEVGKTLHFIFPLSTRNDTKRGYKTAILNLNIWKHQFNYHGLCGFLWIDTQHQPKNKK